MERHQQEKKRFRDIISSIDLKDQPLFYPGDKWLASEEVALLTSVELYGHGNWSIIADTMSERFNKEFTAEEVHDHFQNTYMEGEIAEAMKGARADIFKCSVTDHTTKEDDEALLNMDMNAHKNVPSEFLKEIGYMPLREDFEEEYDISAEDLLYYSHFRDADEYDKNLNLILLDVYRIKLQTRYELKNAIRKYRLVEQYFASSTPSIKKISRNKNKTFETLQTLLRRAFAGERNNLPLTPKKSKSKLKKVPVQDSKEEKGLILPRRLRPRHSGQ